MARPIWTGALSFGLVNVPVRMYPATQEKQVRFRQLEVRELYERAAEAEIDGRSKMTKAELIDALRKAS